MVKKGMVTQCSDMQIKELIQIFEHSDLNNMEVTLGNASVKLGRGMANAVEESPEAQMGTDSSKS